MQTACEITIELSKSDVETQISFIEGSSIHAREIFIVAPSGRLSIDGTSVLETDGRSLHSKGSSHSGATG